MHDDSRTLAGRMVRRAADLGINPRDLVAHDLRRELLRALGAGVPLEPGVIDRALAAGVLRPEDLEQRAGRGRRGGSGLPPAR